jgi:hypothetical protein
VNVRQEVIDYIQKLSDDKLEALKPILYLLADEPLNIETDLTDEERDIIKAGMDEYEKNPNSFVSLDTIE